MDDPASPYPLAELEWKADMNGDGALLWPGTPEKSTVFVMWSRERQGSSCGSMCGRLPTWMERDIRSPR